MYPLATSLLSRLNFPKLQVSGLVPDDSWRLDSNHLGNVFVSSCEAGCDMSTWDYILYLAWQEFDYVNWKIRFDYHSVSEKHDCS